MMLTQSSLHAIGNWKSKIGVPLKTALHVSMDICGRDGNEACKHALILMAQSARAITPQAKAMRDVENNPAFVHLLRSKENGSTYREARAAGRDMSRYYKYRYFKETSAGKIAVYGNNPKNMNRIRNRGLAKRSWLWGLSVLGSRRNFGRPIPGVSTVRAVNLPWRHGYQLTNRLSYVLKIMPSGWQATVEQRAGNKIMAQATRKLEARWRAAVGVPKSTPIARPDLARIFSQALVAG